MLMLSAGKGPVDTGARHEATEHRAFDGAAHNVLTYTRTDFTQSLSLFRPLYGW